MQELGDVELLKEYARSGSEEAFSTLVSRHINLVFGAAMRQTGDPHRAQEVSQVVFIILAKKAGSLSDATILPGWLFQTTRLTAANLRRTEFRRAQREREAMVQAPETESGEGDVWRRVAPMLDLALAGLKEKDRNAILIRFMEGKNFQEVGAAMGMTEAAAQKRVNRAVEKLRAFFTKREVVLTGAALGGALAAKSASAAPSGIVSAVKAAAVSMGVLAGPSTAALMKGTLKTMGWSYPKQMGAVLLAALLLTGGLGSLAARREIPDGLTPGDIYRRTRQRYDSLTSYRANGEESISYGGQRKTFAFYTHLGRPDYYRVEWAMPIITDGNVENVPDLGALWSAGKGPFIMTGSLPAPGSGRTPSSMETFLYYKMDDDQRAIMSVLGLADGAISVPVIFLKLGTFDRLNEVAEAPNVQRLKDETVDGFRCFVLARTFGQKFAKSGMSPRMEKFWIGKSDFLIHQIENDTMGINRSHPPQTPNSTVTLIKFRNIKVDEPVNARDFDYPMPRHFELQANFP